MPVPDSNQKAIAGEYYVSSLLSRMGYAVALTIGNAKTIDMMASSQAAKSVNFQVKTTAKGYDWLVRGRFPDRSNLLVALVRLGPSLVHRPEVYVLTVTEANSLVDTRYAKHSPRISLTKVRSIARDHDLSSITRILGE